MLKRKIGKLDFIKYKTFLCERHYEENEKTTYQVRENTSESHSTEYCVQNI
jgi:hypothetical protein